MRFKINLDFLTDWTVGGVSFIYRLFVQHLYFILSNLLFLVMLFFFQLTLNNYILFVLPIFLFLVSLAVQFRVAEFTKGTISIRKYGHFYGEMLRNHWKVFIFYTFLISFIVFDMKALWILGKSIMFIPLLTTASFLASGMLFVLLLSTDKRARELTVGRKVFSMLLVSYKLPLVTLVNIFWFMIIIFLMQKYAMLYLLFFGGAVNFMILMNLKRRFSVDLFFEQIENEVKE